MFLPFKLQLLCRAGCLGWAAWSVAMMAKSKQSARMFVKYNLADSYKLAMQPAPSDVLCNYPVAYFVDGCAIFVILFRPVYSLLTD